MSRDCCSWTKPGVYGCSIEAPLAIELDERQRCQIGLYASRALDNRHPSTDASGPARGVRWLLLLLVTNAFGVIRRA
jgi:hypothetical protein